MYPHLTEIQKINYFHSLLRGDALHAFCNIEDTKKDSLDEIMTIFKRRFGDYLSIGQSKMRMGRAQIRSLEPETPRIPRYTSKNCQRSLRL